MTPGDPRREAATLIDEVAARREAGLDANRPDAVEKQRRRGALTARERITLLLDEGAPFLEYGALAQPVDYPRVIAPADAVVVGTGPVHGHLSVIVSFDYTALGGSQGVANHAKAHRAWALADKLEAPVFILSEGGGGRAQELTQFFKDKQGDDMNHLARLSGRVPLIGLGLGRAFAGHAIYLGECDTVIATKGAVLGIAGPPLVKAATGLDLTPEQIGAAEFHVAAGAVEVLVDDDRQAIAEARRYAEFFLQPFIQHEQGGDDGVPEGLRDFHKRRREGPVDSRELITMLADPQTPFELRPAWAQAVITTLARIGGRAIGIVASQPTVADGAMLGDEMDKIARFIQLCDTFGLPLLFIVDTPGLVGGAAGAADAMVRHAARVVHTLGDLRVPVATVVVGRAFGFGEVLMGGRAWEPVLSVLWPGAELRPIGMIQDESGKTAAHSWDGDALKVAERYGTDDVIHPSMTRDTLCQLIRSLPVLGVRSPQRYIDPW